MLTVMAMSRMKSATLSRIVIVSVVDVDVHDWDKMFGAAAAAMPSCRPLSPRGALLAHGYHLVAARGTLRDVEPSLTVHGALLYR